MPITLGCIADDFTGATDLANMLVKGGLKTIQLLGTPSKNDVVPSVDAVIIALKTRTIPVEEAIEGRDYLIGDFSAADTMLGHACIMSKRLGAINEENYPNLSAYAERLLARPACAKAFSA